MSTYGRKANFMEHLAPDNRIQATGIRTLEQCGRQALQCAKDARRKFSMGQPYPLEGMTESEWLQKRRAENFLEKRKERGGETYQAGNILETL